MIEFGQHLAGQRVELYDPLDLIAEELHTYRQFLVSRHDFKSVATEAEAATDHLHVVAFVIHVDQPANDPAQSRLLALAQAEHHRAIFLGRPETVYAGDARNDQRVPAGEQCACGGVAEPVDLLVYVRLFLDISVGLRDVRLGLIVVVVADEILDRVVREEILELGGKLGGERLVVGDHECRALDLLDDLGHRVGLARSRYTQKGLVVKVIFQPA